jgi:hypothetical protein
LKKVAWLLIIALAFALVYFRSLTYLYVEGDDSAGISYHALGRNPAVQPPFSPWQSGMDLIMSGLPEDEETLRKIGISIAAIAAPLLVVMLLALSYSMLDGLARPPIAFGGRLPAARIA